MRLATTMKHDQLWRKLEIIKRLQDGHPVTAIRLAHDFNVSERTIYRDIQALKGAGVEVQFDKPQQSYCLDPLWRLRPPALTDDEIVILIAAAYLSPLYANKHYWGQIRRATGSLLDKVSSLHREEVKRLAKAIDPKDPAQERPQQRDTIDRVLEILIDAIRYDQKVRLTYYDRDAKQELTTLVTPHKLALVQDGWLLKGRSSIHRVDREYRLVDIRTASADTTSKLDRHDGPSPQLSRPKARRAPAERQQRAIPMATRPASQPWAHDL